MKTEGRFHGKVSLKGKKPEAKAYNLVLFPEAAFCGRISTGTGWRLLDNFLVAPDGGLKNAVVMLEGVEKGKPFKKDMSYEIRAQDCVFDPNLIVVRNHQEVSFVNMDPILHDVQVYETSPSGQSVLVHRPMRLNPYHPKEGVDTHEHLPGERLVDKLDFSKGRRTFLIECGWHGFMQTWGVMVENPYFAVTDEGGNFTLKDVPEGVYKLVAWHPGMGGVLFSEVAILGGEIVKTQFEFDAPLENRSAHTTMVENPHYDEKVFERFGQSLEIIPTHEVQKP